MAPGSGVVRRNLPQVPTYADFFQRQKRPEPVRNWRAPDREARQSSQILNYEALQAPLAYGVLAIPARVFASVALPKRVLILRLIAGIGGALLLYFASERLFRRLGMNAAYRNVALFCVFSSQMTWAALAHVGNDWLAVPLAVLLLASAIDYDETLNVRSAAGMAVVLALGLLTKAYFLAFLPLAFGVCAVRRRWTDLWAGMAVVLALAGPWYVRNVARYGAISGMQESRAGMSVMSFHMAPLLSYPTLIYANARAALWTGNNSFAAFSAHTLASVLFVWLAALALWAVTRHGRAEGIAVVYCALFAIALIYDSVLTHEYTHGAAQGPSPWYTQVLLAPVLGLAALGMERWRPGKTLASLLALLFGYILAATYLVKLIPLYSGFTARTTLAAIAELYGRRLASVIANLNLVTLGAGWAVFFLAAGVAALAIALP
ncbi:MAG: hypothetical protein ACRD9L_11195, partial [Bryobacteraceae bacterium]